MLFNMTCVNTSMPSYLNFDLYFYTVALNRGTLYKFLLSIMSIE